MHLHTAAPPLPLAGLLGPRGRAGSGGLAASSRMGVAARSSDAFRVALCAPLRGAAGIWGPSCLASARLAADELNRLSGIAGRPCELHIVDASDEALDVEGTLAGLIDEGEIDALVGMCISSVRQRIVRRVGARVPFVYTCLYEGGDESPGLYAIGETAARQLQPSIAWLSERNKARRWMLVGNDYVWPRLSHRIACQRIAACGGSVVAERFLPFGVDDFSEVIDQLRTTRADAVLISMVGQDAVEFNRAFGRAGLQRHVLRLSCAIEENQLLAIGAENTDNLYVAMGYFAALQTDANLAFTERYAARFGDRAPALNSIGQSLYEGMHFLAALLDDRGARLVSPYPSARQSSPLSGPGDAPIYLAQADGHAFDVMTRF